MNTQEQIETHIASQVEPKRDDMLVLHQRMLHILPGSRVWFSDGKNRKVKPFLIQVLAMAYAP